jgi:hypothetical protein
VRAEFRARRPFAFELQRRGYAVRGWVLAGSGRFKPPPAGQLDRPPFSISIFNSQTVGEKEGLSDAVAHLIQDATVGEMCGERYLPPGLL